MDAQKVISEIVEVLKNNGVDGISRGGTIEVDCPKVYLRDGVTVRKINIRLTQIVPISEEEAKTIQGWGWSVFG